MLAPFSDLADDEESGAGSSAFFRTLAACAQSNHVLLHVYLRGTDEVENTAIGEKSVFEKLSKKVKLRIHIVRPKNGRLLHAKLFAFRVGGNWSLLIGSPNATRPAMIGENGNIELVWEFRKLGKSFPFNLLPPAPPVPLRKIQFQTPKFKYERRWEALESASYTPKSRRMNLIWKPKFGFHNTKLLLGGRPLDPDHVDLRSTEDRFIESRPFIRTSLKYRPGFVPITMPAGQADLPLPDWGDENLSPEQWLGLLGDPLWKPEGVRHGGRKGGHGQSHEPQSKGLFHWRTQVLGLSKKLQSLRDSISETTTSQELDRLMHVLEGVWKSHDASLKGLPAIDVAWRKWVRAAIWQVLRDECDGRLKNHQDLCALRARWKSKISKVLKEFPIA